MKDRLASGVLLLGVAKVLINFLALLSTFVLARLLTPEDFGLVAVATTLLSIIGPITDLSLSAALIQQRSLTEDHFHTAWTLGAVRGVVLGVVLAGAAPMLSGYYEDPRLTGVMLALSASVVLGGLANPKVAFLTKGLNFWPSFVVAVGQKLIGVVVGLIAAYILKSYWALLLGTLASQAAGTAISYWQVRYRPHFSLSQTRDLLSFSVWLTLGQIINTLNWRLDHLFVGLGLGPRALGVYVVGDNLAALPTREVISPIEQALFPGLTAVVDDPDRLRRTYQRAQAMITAAVLPVGVAVALNAEALVQLVLGSKWHEAVIIVQGLAAVFAVQTLGSMVHPLAMAKGQTRLMFLRDAASFAMRVPIIALGAWSGGLHGIVYARIVTGLIAIGINLYVVRGLLSLNLKQQIQNSWRSLTSIAVASGLLMVITISGTTDPGAGQLYQVILHSGFLLATYIVCHFALWMSVGRPLGPESDALDLLKKRLRRSDRSA